MRVFDPIAGAMVALALTAAAQPLQAIAPQPPRVPLAPHLEDGGSNRRAKRREQALARQQDRRGGQDEA